VATRSVTVSQPGITVGTLTVGSGLQDNTSFTLGAPNHGNISVTLTSSDAGVLLSPNATTAGTGQITLPVADGVQTVGFYVQARRTHEHRRRDCYRERDTALMTESVTQPSFKRARLAGRAGHHGGRGSGCEHLRAGGHGGRGERVPEPGSERAGRPARRVYGCRPDQHECERGNPRQQRGGNGVATNRVDCFRAIQFADHGGDGGRCAPTGQRAPARSRRPAAA
jgi:hypothetical protein